MRSSQHHRDELGAVDDDELCPAVTMCEGAQVSQHSPFRLVDECRHGQLSSVSNTSGWVSMSQLRITAVGVMSSASAIAKHAEREICVTPLR